MAKKIWGLGLLSCSRNPATITVFLVSFEYTKTSTPQRSSTKGCPVSIRWISGSLKG